MNILIENNSTFEYLTAVGNWTKIPLGGKPFPATVAAFRVAKQQAIGKFNIVGHIPQTNQFINLSHGSGKGLPGEAGDPVELAQD
ncbi:MAG: hypothetical protein ABSH48_04085 [Verrucomicrobiota bacterium]|jgi:hypothetical protein